MKLSELRQIIKEEIKFQLAERKSYPKGTKSYYQVDNVGKAKYTINFHDGSSTHKDGSKFYGIKILKNKKDLANFISDLSKKGYKAE